MYNVRSICTVFVEKCKMEKAKNAKESNGLMNYQGVYGPCGRSVCLSSSSVENKTSPIIFGFKDTFEHYSQSVLIGIIVSYVFLCHNELSECL